MARAAVTVGVTLRKQPLPPVPLAPPAAQLAMLVPQRPPDRDRPWPLAMPRDELPAWGAPGEGAIAPIVGIERRLVRRAELLWEQLRGDAPLPDRAALRQFLVSSFAPQALLVTGSSRNGGMVFTIEAVGSRLDALGLFAPGPVAPSDAPDAPAAGRLAALAGTALERAGPALLEIDAPGMVPDNAAAEAATGVLLRAIALPFAAEPGGAQPVLVVASWRQLLSPEETARLHGELASAAQWVRTHRGP